MYMYVHVNVRKIVYMYCSVLAGKWTAVWNSGPRHKYNRSKELISGGVIALLVSLLTFLALQPFWNWSVLVRLVLVVASIGEYKSV